MFLSYLSSHNHTMSDCYCGLQKSIRLGNINQSLYWAGQIGNNNNNLKGYPNALKKRLCQISLEDCCSWEFSTKLYLQTKLNSKVTFNELIPWVITLVNLSKTHSTAWLQRVTTQYIYEGGNIPDYKISNINNTNELEFASLCMIAHHNNNINLLTRLCENDGKLAISLYKYINNDPLVFHAWQMHQRRSEIRERVIEVQPLSSYGITEQHLQLILSTCIELDEIWFDKHTKKGKKLGRGYEHFFQIMVFHPRLYPLNNENDDNDNNLVIDREIRKGTEPYEEIAKALYLDFRIDGKEVKSKELLSMRRSNTQQKFLDLLNGECKLLSNIQLNPQTDSLKRNRDNIESTTLTTSTTLNTTVTTQSIKRQRNSNNENNNNTTTRIATTITTTNSNPEIINDIDIFEIDSETTFLGYKNITMICKLKKQMNDLHNISIGDKIFVKIGESEENCKFSLTCEKLRNELGMVNYSTQSTVLWVLPTLNYPELVGLQHPNWIQSITKHYNSFKNKYSNELNLIPVYITGVFNGIHLCDAFHPPHHTNTFIQSNNFGKQLLEILLFRKYFGISDTNGTNILINLNDRLIYSIDENMASSQQISSYNKNGLITSQKINKKILIKVGNYLLSNKNNVKETTQFIQKMCQLVIPNNMNMNRMIETHNMCPFDSDTRNFLQEYIKNNNTNNNNNLCLKKLKDIITRLKLQYLDGDNDDDNNDNNNNNNDNI